jgi:hypothetical protein
MPHSTPHTQQEHYAALYVAPLRGVDEGQRIHRLSSLRHNDRQSRRVAAHALDRRWTLAWYSPGMWYDTRCGVRLMHIVDTK